MIHVDETEPVEDLPPAFSNRIVEVKNADPKEFYKVSNEELGRGKFGTVFVCEDKETNLKLAGKFVKYTKKDERIDMEREVEIMNSLRHPRLIQLYDAFDYDKTFVVMLEFIEGGELFERVIDDDFILTEKACTIFMKQIIEGIQFTHNQNIIHLDMKPENVLCVSKEGNRIKIIDFGMARRYDKNKNLQVLFGTPEFAAPEVVNFDRIGFYTDMWSIGVICYVLLSGLSPFMGDDDVETMTNVSLGKYDFKDETFDKVSEDAKDFIKQLLTKDANKRLTSKQALDHKWIHHKEEQTTELSSTKSKLKRYVIKKRWIKAVNTIIALQRMGAKF